MEEFGNPDCRVRDERPGKGRCSRGSARAATAVVFALATLCGIFVWRLRSPGELPDLGDPFDLELWRGSRS